jgi:hypothetical protein
MKKVEHARANYHVHTSPGLVNLVEKEKNSPTNFVSQQNPWKLDETLELNKLVVSHFNKLGGVIL